MLQKVLEIKREEIQNRSKYSIFEHGWLPGLFRTIVQKAKSILELLIRQAKLPPKPKPGIDMAVFREIETTGIFKGKERKAIEAKIETAEKKVSDLKDRISRMVQEHGYPDGQAFMAAYNKAESIVKHYEWNLAEWKQQTEGKPAEEKKPPEHRSIVAQLHKIRNEAQKPMLLQFIVTFQSNISSHKLSALSLTTRELLWSFAMPFAIIYSK